MPKVELHCGAGLFLPWFFSYHKKHEKHTAGLSRGVIGRVLNGSDCKLCLHQLEAP